MSIQTAKAAKNEHHFGYIVALTATFLLLEIGLFLHSYGLYLHDFMLLSHTVTLPWAIFPSIGFFIFAQLLLHLLFCVFIYICSSSVISLFAITKHKQFTVLLVLWLIGIATTLSANQIYFPNSQFAELMGIIFFNTLLAKSFFLVSTFCCFVVGMLSVVNIVRIGLRYPEYSASLLFGGCLIAILLLFFKDHNVITPRGTVDQPNIIIIGVDSLRPDYLSFFGSQNKTPFFDTFLNQATVFSDAVTPLARTFPSWSSILTGRYPKQIGTRTNLGPQEHIDIAKALPKLLHEQGYETIYATDETRFSNIDERYGFDRIVGPPMGVNDFILGTFNDFPLSNLIVNTGLGKWLFPYSYANRAVFTTYNPDSFINLLDEAILEKNTQPLFLVAHFCLPHFPYLWAKLAANQFSPVARYPETVKRVDNQAHAFFNLLEQKKLIDHAVVIILSDHGEALELPGDRLTEKELYISSNKSPPPRFYPQTLQEEGMNQSAGHGTDVLGMTQNHTVLAFKLYGLGKQRVEIVPGLVSTLDIKPTLLSLLDLPTGEDTGQSLLDVIRGIATPEHKRLVFIESDYSPEAMRTVYPEIHKVILEGLQLFKIDPDTARLVVKPEMEEKIVKSKQYADIYDNWMLALYPQNKHQRMPILINLVTGKWTNDLSSDFATHSPVKHMLSQLHSFYGDELR